MEVITLNGREFIKASKAAGEVGYTSDYVGQLCRSGSITAERVGRNWYVDREELREHKTEKKRNARTKAREHVRKVIHEKKIKETEKPARPQSKKTFEHRYLSHGIDTQYATDSRPLIPEIKKTARNKDFKSYIVEDVPEITALERRVPNSLPDRMQVPIRIKQSVKTEPNQVQQRRELPVQTKIRKEPIRIIAPEEESWDEEELIATTNNTHSKWSILWVVGAVVVTILILVSEGVSSVQISTNSGSKLNQITSSYSLNIANITKNIWP